MAFRKLCSTLLLASALQHGPDGAAAVPLPAAQTLLRNHSNLNMIDPHTTAAVKDATIDVAGAAVAAKAIVATEVVASTAMTTAGAAVATSVVSGAAAVLSGGVNVVARGLRKLGFKHYSEKKYIVFKGQGGLINRSSSYMRADGSVKEKGSNWGDWAFTLLGGWLLKPVWVRVNFALDPDTLEVTKICTHGRNTRVVGLLHDVNVSEKKIIIKLGAEEHKRLLERGDAQDALPYMMVKYDGYFDSWNGYQRNFTQKSDNIDNNLVRLRAAQLAFELREAQKALDGSVGLLARAKTTFLQQAGEPSQETREAEQRLQAVKDTINAESLQGLVH